MADIGTGTIILLVLWIVSFFALIAFCAAQSGIKYVALVPVIIASIVTLILGLLPIDTTSTSKTVTIDDTVYSYVSLLWILFLTGILITFIVCLLIYFISEIIEPRYAKVGRQIYYVPQ